VELKQDRVDILGVEIDRHSAREVIHRIEQELDEGRTCLLIPVNPEMVVVAQQNASFKAVLNAATIRLPDGIGILLASKIVHRPIPERVTGVDTLERVVALAARRRLRMFFLGAADGIAARTAQIFQERYPNLQVAGTFSGSPRPEDEDRICSMVRDSNADVLAIAYGAPKQELWIARNFQRLGIRIGMCVGGSFDFVTGIAPRAPEWMQRWGLEWLFRLVRQPSRWRRMLRLPRFFILVLLNRFMTGKKDVVR